MSTRRYPLISIVTAAIAASAILVLVNAELLNGHLDTATRSWLLWVSLLSTVVAIAGYIVKVARSVRVAQTAILQRLDRIERNKLDDAVRDEIREALSESELTAAVEQAVAPTLHAISDYKQFADASVTHLPRTPRGMK